MKRIVFVQSLVLISIFSATVISEINISSLKAKETSTEKISAMEKQLDTLQKMERSLEEQKEAEVEKQTIKDQVETNNSPEDRQLEDENAGVSDMIPQSQMGGMGMGGMGMGMGGMGMGVQSPSLLPPPPPIFSTGKLPVQTQYHIVHYPSHVNTPWNMLSYPRVMAPHYGYQGYPLHPYNFMHMAHAAHTAMLGGHLGAVGATMGMGMAHMAGAGMGHMGMGMGLGHMAGMGGMGHMGMGMGGMGMNPYMHSPYSMGLHPFGYMPPVGMPYMPYATYGLGGFSSPFPYGAYGSFGYSSPMMGGMNKKTKRARKLRQKKRRSKKHLV